ncbi:MAG: Fur family transcriptional regulator [Patescibacteria group bacterium UBA2163]
MRLTQKRKQVLKALTQKGGMFTAQEISARIPDIDLTTVYRSLELFQQEGIVREVILPSKESAYEYISDKHHHVVCNTCDQVQHIKLKEEELQRIPALKHLDPNSIEITVRGNCKT